MKSAERVVLKKSDLISKTAPSVISVHSWVSHGHVGHGMALFVLLRMGIRVTMVPCVIYSSSLSYDVVAGGPLDASLIDGLCKAIAKQPTFNEHSAMWTGFLGTPECARSAMELLEEMRTAHGAPVRYICDPVLGDRGSLYVPESMVKVYQEELLKEASAILPNRFELGWLLGKSEANSVEDAFTNGRELLNKYSNLEAVVATGLPDADDSSHLSVVLLERDQEPLVVKVESFDRHFAGAGDLFSGVFTACQLKGLSYRESFLNACGRTAAVIEATQESGYYELRVIENQHVLDDAVDVSAFYQVQ